MEDEEELWIWTLFRIDGMNRIDGWKAVDETNFFYWKFEELQFDQETFKPEQWQMKRSSWIGHIFKWI